MALVKLMAAVALVAAATCGVASAQNLPEGRVYTFHSAARGGCPELDWHVVVQGNNALVGMISWNNMQSMARATGTVDPNNHSFQMTAVEVGGQGRTAQITGQVEPTGVMVADIEGPGVSCKHISVQWWVPQGGGGSG